MPESSRTTEPFAIRIDAQQATLEQLLDLEESIDDLEQSQQNWDRQVEDFLGRVFSPGTFTPERRDGRENGSERHHDTTDEEDDRREFSGMYS